MFVECSPSQGDESQGDEIIYSYAQNYMNEKLVFKVHTLKQKIKVKMHVSHMGK